MRATILSRLKVISTLLIFYIFLSLALNFFGDFSLAPPGGSVDKLYSPPVLKSYYGADFPEDWSLTIDRKPSNSFRSLNFSNTPSIDSLAEQNSSDFSKVIKWGERYGETIEVSLSARTSDSICQTIKPPELRELTSVLVAYFIYMLVSDQANNIDVKMLFDSIEFIANCHPQSVIDFKMSTLMLLSHYLWQYSYTFPSNNLKDLVHRFTKGYFESQLLEIDRLQKRANYIIGLRWLSVLHATELEMTHEANIFKKIQTRYFLDSRKILRDQSFEIQVRSELLKKLLVTGQTSPSLRRPIEETGGWSSIIPSRLGQVYSRNLMTIMTNLLVGDILEIRTNMARVLCIANHQFKISKGKNITTDNINALHKLGMIPETIVKSWNIPDTCVLNPSP